VPRINGVIHPLHAACVCSAKSRCSLGKVVQPRDDVFHRPDASCIRDDNLACAQAARLHRSYGRSGAASTNVPAMAHSLRTMVEHV
jgi:hypothetical protein